MEHIPGSGEWQRDEESHIYVQKTLWVVSGVEEGVIVGDWKFYRAGDW
jgi:hypothetical protein